MMAVIGFVITIAILVLIHEWGHYIVARMCGVRVLAFSLGFGKVIYKRVDRRGCEWRLSMLPLGGYVKMLTLQERQEYEKQGLVFSNEDYEKGAFEYKSVWKRFAVVAAGPLMNIVLAIMIFAALAMMGTYEPSSKLGSPLAGTQAQQMGIQSGWRIDSVDGAKVQTFNDVRWKLMARLGDRTVPVQLSDASGASRWVDFNLQGLGESENVDPMSYLGLTNFVDDVRIIKTLPESPAQKAGLMAGDQITAVNGTPVSGVQQLIAVLKSHPNRPLALSIVSIEGVSRDVMLTPQAEQGENGETVGKIGASLATTPDVVLTQMGPLDALVHGAEQCWDFIAVNLKSVSGMISGQVSTSNISGPVAIGSMAGETLQYGVLPFMLFLAMMSVSLGVLNLLPIPVLDGGHLVSYIYEMLVGRQPSEKVMVFAQKVGMFALLLLTFYALSNDLTKVLG